MDAAKLATLKKKLLEATDFIEIADCFVEDLGNDPEFARSGKPYNDKRFLTALAQATSRALGGKTGVFQGTPRRIAEHRMVHAAFTFGDWIGMMFYFEDVEQGFMALGDQEGPNHFVRFTLIATPDGKPPTVH